MSTHSPLAAPLATKIKTRVIACGMIAREVLAINEQLGDAGYDVMCLPAEYHHFPAKIAPAMDIAISKAKQEGYDNIFIGYADCGTCGELDKVCEKHGVERIEGPHCFSFYIGNEQFTKDDGKYITTFFITDFLARHFNNFLIKPLGLDKNPELKDMYFGNYTHALYIAQTEDLELQRLAREAADYLGLEYEYKLTRFGDLTTALTTLKS